MASPLSAHRPDSPSFPEHSHSPLMPHRSFSPVSPHRPEPPPALHRSSDARITSLTNRLNALQTRLKTAMGHEHLFARDLHTAITSLESFIDRHRADDEYLARLVNEDTQRSRDARDEYDVLSATFDDVLRPNASTRWRDFVAAASLYVGIALSVVFIAPLHFVASLFEAGLRRLGYHRIDAGGGAERYSDSSRRARLRQGARRVGHGARGARGKAVSRQRRRGTADRPRVPGRDVRLPETGTLTEQSPALPRRGEDGSTEKGSPGVEIVVKDFETPNTLPEEGLTLREEFKSSAGESESEAGGSSTAATSREEGSKREEAESALDITIAEDIDKETGSAGGNDTCRQGRRTIFREADSTTRYHVGNDIAGNASDEIAVDQDGTESPDEHSDGANAHESAHEFGMDGDNGGGEEDVESEEEEDDEEDESGRPAWARPRDSEGASMEHISFPSADFWDIQEDDFKIEELKREE